MAPRIHSALLGTAMASGLLLSPVAAHALPITDTAVATTAPGQPAQTEGTATGESGQAAGDVQDNGQESTDPLVVEPAAIAADTGGTDAGQPPSEVDTSQENPEAVDSSATEKEDPDVADEAALKPSPSVESYDAAAGDDSVAEEDPGSADSAPADIDSPPDAGIQDTDQETVPTETTDSGDPEGNNATEAIEEANSPLIIEESADELEVPAWFPTIAMPEGSEAWDENQWNEFLDSDDGKTFIDEYNNARMESPELQTIVEILTDFANTGDESYLDELWDYLNELFPDNPEWAQEAYDGIMAGIGEWGLTEPDSPEPSTPTEQPQKPSPEIKPAATVAKPVVQQKPVAQALAKPIVDFQKQELANTGSDGTLLIGGVGVALLLGGVLTLGMRRRQKGR
ncbi:LPXTG cell wall anchor domain-containing protein [Paeniglutamicibacter sp. MACA_103]|uniref:LPXTG cell wall anchor domain-containing protein n=1 Tax=Paeniglutamicibacter sp. MACA_103 TaxID=3377337 RepID=UPI003893B5FA